MYKVKKATGKVGKELEEELKAHNSKKDIKTSKAKQPKGISKIEGSTYYERLADAKAHYDFNQSMIDMLSKDIMEMDTYLNDNKNGTVSMMPQFRDIKEFEKINIQLRNQIEDLESKLGYGAQEEDPF